MGHRREERETIKKRMKSSKKRFMNSRFRHKLMHRLRRPHTTNALLIGFESKPHILRLQLGRLQRDLRKLRHM